MVAKKGLLFLLKLGAVAASPVTVAACRTTAMTINNELVDVTTKDSNRYRTLLEGAGVRAITISLEGVFDNSDIIKDVRDFALADSINTFSLFYDNGDTLEGGFQISSWEDSGDYNTEQPYTFTLESSGQFVFTRA